jgi:uncharacterized protein YggE
MKLPLLALLTLPITLLAQGGLPNQPYIYVEGKAEIKKPADIVTMRFDLVGRNADPAKANQDVQGKANKAFGLLNERKIAEQDVVAGDVRSEAEYASDSGAYDKRGKVTGYSVTRPFTVKIRDVTIFPKLVDDLFALGAEFSGIEPGLSNDEQMQEDIWDKAIANSRERAEKTLKTMAMKIDSIFAVSPIAFPQIHAAIFGSTGDSVQQAVAGYESPGQPHYRLAPVAISQSVHVIYLISPTK